ncbi:MAG: hypothetical protein EGR77_09345 [Pseudobutyrivibrio sp.]|nr:hypothetical protein [Pseudobutyrivibrio sp.]
MKQNFVRKVSEKYPTDSDIKNLMKYIADDQKCRHYIGARRCRKKPEQAALSMIRTQKGYKKTTGRRINHWIISFEKNVVDPKIVYDVAEQIADLFSEEYQVFYGIHENTDNLHIHMAVNTVSFRDGRKWHTSKKELAEWKWKMNKIKDDVINSTKKRR